ncbi:BTAD domain-containing putative transcriptional regulator [Knoellia sp. CPCC 206450]|uniref:BTAD domain-containing putative transcriptional regulator n=1 Tax=Knoellia tibetensis TaxID=3404798 RepID=UPI003B42EC62
MSVQVSVLGATALHGSDGPVEIAARKRRALLAALALDLGPVVSADRLVALMWGDEAPPGAYGTLHSYVSGLRRLLEPGLAARAKPTVLLTSDEGYRLALPRDAVDATAFADEVRSRHRVLGSLASQLTTGPDETWPGRGEVEEQVEGLEQALRRWRGTPYADLTDHPDVLAARTGLEGLRTTANDDLVLGLLALGEHATVLPLTEQATAREPLRERGWALHALALARAGRQAEALDAIRRLRGVLDDELGLDPGQEVRDLETALLRQDPAVLGGWLANGSALPIRVTRLEDRRDQDPGDPPLGPTSRGTGEPSAIGRDEHPLVGRTREREVLRQLLGDAFAGRPAVVRLVGEAGAGKSRLVDWAVAEATERGMAAAVGTCSADEGAPPLWPWRQLLTRLDLPTPPELAHDPSGDTGDGTTAERAFAAHDAIARTVREAARDSGLLLVLDDLHWADTPTMRCLAQVVASLGPGDRVAVVATRRATGGSAAAAELDAALARHGATTLELGGLADDEARDLVGSILGADARPEVVADWRARTDGNPFFLVELARLAEQFGRVDGEVPESVQSVVRHRVADLSEPVRELLLLAAALGRQHPPLLLARVADLDPEELLDWLEPAHEAGILHSTQGLLSFDHALTRDAILAMTTPNRLSRTHARIARALEAAPPSAVNPAERAFDLAHHWLAAGPLYAGSAWPAAAAAGALAADDFANVEAADLFKAALGAQAADPQGSAYERFDLLLRFNESAARAGMWREAVDAVVEAVAVARALDDPARVATAVASLTRYSVWAPMDFGVVEHELVDDLRATLARLEPGGSRERCTLMLALAAQLYYLPGSDAEAEALVDEGMALARRFEDPALLAWAARTAQLALWRCRYLGMRRALSEEEVAAARSSGDVAAEAVALAGLASAAVEAGDRATWESASGAALTIARRRRLAYVEFALRFVELNLLVLRTDDDPSAAADELRGLTGVTMSIPASDYIEFGIAYALAAWNPPAAKVLAEQMAAADPTATDDMTLTPMLHLSAVAGDRDRVEQLLSRTSLPTEDWSESMDLALLAIAATAVEDADLARQVAERLGPLSGRMAVAGTASLQGPVDCFLAMALATAGDAEAARVAADRGEATAREWGMHVLLDRFAEQRRSLGN